MSRANGTVVLCHEPPLSDETAFTSISVPRFECEASGCGVKCQTRLSTLKPSTSSELQSSPHLTAHLRVPLSHELFLAERAVRRAENLVGSHRNFDVLSAVNDMESTRDLLEDGEKEATVKCELQNLELKLDALSRLSRHQKLVSLPLESVRPAVNTLHLFVALNEVVAQLRSAVTSLSTMHNSSTSSRLICIDSQQAAAMYYEALRLNEIIGSVENSVESTETKLQGFFAKVTTNVRTFRDLVDVSE
jgi:hypothetical protein